jgi:TPR repeat protein
MAAVWFRGALVALLLAVVAPAAADEVGGDLAWLEKQAAAGDAEAWYRIGVIKEQGIGLPADAAGAVAAYRSAAGLGHAEAQVRLAQLLAEAGQFEEARLWYETAAAQGHAAAAYNAGLFAETGTGGVVDPAAAADFYKQAAKAGIGQAAVQLALLHYHGALGTVDRVAALAWMAKAQALGVGGAAAIAAAIEAEATAEERAAAAELAKTL